MAALSFDLTSLTGRRSPTRPPSPLPPNGIFSPEETPRAPVRIPPDDGAPATAPTPTPPPTPQKRLAMFTDKLSSSTSSFTRSPAQLLPGSRSHSQHPRTDSQLRENAGSPAPLIAPSTSGGASSKVHSSPSKVRCVREPLFFLFFLYGTHSQARLLLTMGHCVIRFAAIIYPAVTVAAPFSTVLEPW
jgi:hypothetical protein